MKIVAMAREKNLLVKETNIQKLNALSENANHQGVVALCAATEYCSVEDILALAKERNEDPFILIADEIEDPHNLGAIIRTAEASGVHGVIIPKRRSASVTGVVFKTSAGAVSHMKIAKVGNLTATIKTLKEHGVWVYGADMDGEVFSKTNFSGSIALVIGSEGKGMGRLVKENCDVLVKIPMFGKVNSLNASVASGILMYQVVQSRLK